MSSEMILLIATLVSAVGAATYLVKSVKKGFRRAEKRLKKGFRKSEEKSDQRFRRSTKRLKKVEKNANRIGQLAALIDDDLETTEAQAKALAGEVAELLATQEVTDHRLACLEKDDSDGSN